MTYYKKTPIDRTLVEHAKSLVVEAQTLRKEGGGGDKEVCLLLLAVMELVAHADQILTKLNEAEDFIDRMSAVVN